ncbi:hypothetical protein D3C78_1087570 [compost metagenome]
MHAQHGKALHSLHIDFKHRYLTQYDNSLALTGKRLDEVGKRLQERIALSLPLPHAGNDDPICPRKHRRQRLTLCQAIRPGVVRYAFDVESRDGHTIAGRNDLHRKFLLLPGRIEKVVQLSRMAVPEHKRSHRLLRIASPALANQLTMAYLFGRRIAGQLHRQRPLDLFIHSGRDGKGD